MWKNILKNMLNILNSILGRHHKITLLLITIIVFTFIYFILDDLNFSGVNKVQEIMRDEIVKKEVEPKVNEVINETFITLSDYKWESENDNINGSEDPKKSNLLQEEKKKQVIDEKSDETKDAVKNQELDPEQLQPSTFQKLFNRFYFSVITGCLLGYGDIYPVTNISKTCSLLQSLITLMLILY